MDAVTSEWKFDEKQDICIVSKCLPTKYLLRFNKYQILINFTEGNFGRCHLNQVIEITNPNNGTGKHCVPSDINLEEHWVSAVVFLPKIHKSHLITRKHEKDLNWATFYKVTSIYALETSRSSKRKYSTLKGTKETWQWDAKHEKHDSGSGHGH